MSSRQIQKALKQKEREEMESKAEESDEEAAQAPAFNLFDLLENSDKEQGSDTDSEPATESAAPPAPQALSKKHQRKKKAKATSKGILVADDSFDEIDQSVKELNEKYGMIDQACQVTAGQAPPKLRLLGAQPKMLDSNAEMKRIFGSLVINQTIERNRRRTTAGASSIKKYLLANPTDSWPRPAKSGLDMELVNKSTSEDGEQIATYSFTHSHQYSDVQFQFLRGIHTHDPNQITHIIQMHPYHIDALLQLSEISRQSNNITNAAELIERALYAFERAFHPSFSLTSGLCRLDYRRVESRPFFNALYRHMNFVSRQGCWATAFEVCRLLYSLDTQDPLGALLAKRFQWLESAYSAWSKSRQLEVLVNWRYSLALAQFLDNRISIATETLIEAIFYMPYFVSKVLAKIESPAHVIASCPYYYPAGSAIIGEDPEAGLISLVDLYIERSSTLWKEPKVLAWLIDTLKTTTEMLALKSELQSRAEKFRSTRYVGGVPLNVQRHVYLSELHPAIPNLPLSNLTQLGISAHDPVPPRDSIRSLYDQGESTTNPYEGMGVVDGFLRSLLPWLPEAGQEEGQQRRRPRRAENNHMQDLVQAAATLPGLLPEGDGVLTEGSPEWVTAIRDALARVGLFTGDAEAEDDEEEVAGFQGEQNNA